MANSRFWKFAAVMLIVGVFYVGHGLHEKSGFTFPSFVNQAKANGITTQAAQGPKGNTVSFAVTCSPDGKKVYYFGPKEYQGAFATEAYIGSLSVQ